MRSVLVSLIASGYLLAGDFVLGFAAGMDTIDSDLIVGETVWNQDTTSLSATLKIGYDISKIRTFLYYKYEDYKDDMALNTEQENTTIGVEFDYVDDDMYFGGIVGRGSKYLGGGGKYETIEYSDIGIKYGMLEDGLDFGVELKRRSYDSVAWRDVIVKQEDMLLGFFVGYNFSYNWEKGFR